MAARPPEFDSWNRLGASRGGLFPEKNPLALPDQSIGSFRRKLYSPANLSLGTPMDKLLKGPQSLGRIAEDNHQMALLSSLLAEGYLLAELMLLWAAVDGDLRLFKDMVICLNKGQGEAVTVANISYKGLDALQIAVHMRRTVILEYLKYELGINTAASDEKTGHTSEQLLLKGACIDSIICEIKSWFLHAQESTQSLNHNICEAKEYHSSSGQQEQLSSQFAAKANIKAKKISEVHSEEEKSHEFQSRLIANARIDTPVKLPRIDDMVSGISGKLPILNAELTHSATAPK